MSALQAAEAVPTNGVLNSIADRQKALSGLMAKWTAFKTQDLTALNIQLKAANLPAVEIKD